MKRVLLAVGCLVACGDGSSSSKDAAPEPAPNLSLTDENGTAISSLVLAQTNVGQGSSGRVRVTNSGQGATGPLALAISGDAANDFVLDNAQTTCAAKALAAAESCDVVVQFRPTAVGTRNAALAISSSPGGTHTVALMGNAIMPDLRFNPTSVSFGQFEVGQGTQTTIELRNDGSSPAGLDDIVVTGAGFTRGASTCGATLAAGASCDITLNAAPPTLGLVTGNLTVTSGGEDYAAGLTARGARRITVVRQGNGAGTVSSSPIGIDCNATCTALFEGATTLTAVPGATSAIAGWSVAGCGTSATCVVPAAVTPVTVTVDFSSTASSSLNLVFAGNGTGEVHVRKVGAGIVATCFASCSVPVTPGDELLFAAFTPSEFGGYTGTCASSTQDCSLTVPGGASTVTVTFQKDVKEQWTRFLPGTVPHAAAFDATGNLIVASTTKLTKLGPTGSTIWTMDMNVSALDTGPGDTIYIVTNTGLLKKLDAAGGELWSQTAGSVCTRGHAVAVASDGAVAVRYGGTVSRWTTAGVASWTKTFTGTVGRCSVAIDGSGNVAVDVENANFQSTDTHRYAPDGTDLGLQLALSPEYFGMVSSSPTGAQVVCTTGHGNSHLTAPGISKSLAITSAASAPNWCAMASTDAAWVYWQDDTAVLDPTNWRASRTTNANAEVWSITRTTFLTNFTKYGTAPFAVAGSTAGRIAIVGHYVSMSTDTAWVQTYDP